MARMFARAHVLLPVAIALGVGGCVVDKGLELSLQSSADTTALASTTVRVYRDRCPTRQEMVLDLDGALGVAYDETGAPGTLPAIGELDPRTWSFAALGRGRDCAPLLFGCADADVSLVDRVVITLDAEPWEGPVCGSETGCAEGACAGPPVATCDPRTEPACAPPCAGVDLTRDPDHCGACEHACPTDLLCASSLCRPVPRPDRLVLWLDTGSTSVPSDLTGLWVALAWAQLDLTGSTTPRIIEVTHALGLDAASGTDGPIEIPIADVQPPIRARTSLPGGTPFAAAMVVLTPDTDGDGTIGPLDLPNPMSPETPREAYGVGDVALVWAEREVGRDPAVGTIAPEGLLTGLAAYRHVGEVYLPAGPDAVFALRACLASAGSAVDASCVASLPTPLER